MDNYASMKLNGGTSFSLTNLEISKYKKPMFKNFKNYTKITRLESFLLWFVLPEFSRNEGIEITYKKLFGKIFIIDHKIL